VVRGEFQTARDVGTRLLTIAEARGDTTLLLMARNALGIVSLYAGEFETALDHLERGLALFDSGAHSRTEATLFRLVPPGVTCAIHAGWTQWMLGYPDRAADHTREALALARSLDQPFGVSYACHLAAALHRWRGEYRVVQELEEEALAHDAEHGFGLLLTAGVIQRGWLLAERGQRQEGLAQMQEGLAKHREIGAVVLVPAFMGVVAELHQALGRPAEALSTVREALAVAQQSGQHYWESELYRLTGVLTLQATASPGREAASTAESHFRRALEIARRQRTKWLELRAATNLTRLWADQGKVSEGRALLSGVYTWFTEGSDTADLREAKALLDTLTT
jgi:predicted ATPase